ncbi:hypothetical protein DOTSEDRAFT_25635 [Dothistroma septosporum NZE10]|uniref:Uncharacterized protein n=1 Tax=Dothistroma septosporum (strain NZE10 / CBS 128990) TaxID=675120 RepID=N1PIL5_DOTSN|nr:hypothetical protein DOTSEDRAFT_25635 [Dothistroma septosporum NZE10]
MAPSKRAFYESCTIEELHIFIKNRAIKDSKDDILFWTTRASKRSCIGKLEELDDIGVLHFMDLHTELRFDVCGHLLVKSPRHIDVSGKAF